MDLGLRALTACRFRDERDVVSLLARFVTVTYGRGTDGTGEVQVGSRSGHTRSVKARAGHFPRRDPLMGSEAGGRRAKGWGRSVWMVTT